MDVALNGKKRETPPIEKLLDGDQEAKIIAVGRKGQVSDWGDQRSCQKSRLRRPTRRRGEHFIFAEPLDEGLLVGSQANADLEQLDDALPELACVDARASKVVELRFFGGMQVRETAEILNVSDERSPRTGHARKPGCTRN